MSFRVLRQVPILQTRYAAYQQWLALTPAARQAAYAGVTTAAARAQASREKGYVVSFNTSGTAEVYLETRILSATQSGPGATLAGVVRGLVTGRTFTATEVGALTTPIILPAKKYKFAKLALTTVVPSTSTTNSRITGAGYKKPNVDTATSSFGGLTAAEDYSAAVVDISDDAAFTSHLAGNAGKNRAKFTPEG